jgi:hypothetical protein
MLLALLFGGGCRQSAQPDPRNGTRLTMTELPTHTTRLNGCVPVVTEARRNRVRVIAGPKLGCSPSKFEPFHFISL